MATQLAERRYELICRVLKEELGTGPQSWRLQRTEYHFKRNGEDRDGAITCKVFVYNTDHRVNREHVGILEHVGYMRIEPDGVITRFDCVPVKILRSVTR